MIRYRSADWYSCDPAPLDPRVRPHEMVERITTKETPSKLIMIDEETDEEFLSRFGLGCGDLPSDYPERIKRATHHPRTMSIVMDRQYVACHSDAIHPAS